MKTAQEIKLKEEALAKWALGLIDIASESAFSDIVRSEIIQVEQGYVDQFRKALELTVVKNFLQKNGFKISEKENKFYLEV